MCLWDVLTRCRSRAGSSLESAMFLLFPRRLCQDALVFHSCFVQRVQLATCWHHRLFPFGLFVFSLAVFLVSISRLENRCCGMRFLLLFSLERYSDAWAKGGSFTGKEKTSHLLWRKAYIWCLFPSSCPSGREAKPCGAFGLGEPHPSIHLPSSVVFSHIRFYSTNCRLRQQSSEKEYLIIYRRAQLLRHLGKSLVQEQWEGQKTLRIPLCRR